MSVNLPQSNCPQCDALLDAATCAFDAGALPSPGDATICLYCGVALVFTDTLHLRAMTVVELQELNDETRKQLSTAPAAVLELRKDLDEVVQAWASQLPAIEAESLLQTISQIQGAINVARAAPSTLDGRSRTLVITKLEEAEHWALHCLRDAVVRELAAKGWPP